MQVLGYILIIILAGFAGSLSIWLFLKLLFHPIKPVTMFGITLQGIFPKNQASLATSIGKMVSTEMNLVGQLQNKIADPGNFEQLKPEIEEHIDDFLRNKLKVVFPILGNFIGEKTINQLKGAFMQELESMFPALLKSYANNLQKGLNVEKMVAEKINSVSTQTIEGLIYKNAGGKIRALIAGGYILGCIIGLIQVLIAIQISG